MGELTQIHPGCRGTEYLLILKLPTKLNSKMQKVFLDDKFDVVVDELISSRGGWERVNDQSSSN